MESESALPHQRRIYPPTDEIEGELPTIGLRPMLLNVAGGWVCRCWTKNAAVKMRMRTGTMIDHDTKATPSQRFKLATRNP